MKPGFLLIGRVAKPHGIRGQLKVRSFAASQTCFSPGRKIYWCRRDGEAEEGSIAEVKLQANNLLLKLKEVEDRRQAEELTGFDLFIRERDLPALPEGEYYWFQLIGCRVFNDQGRFLGHMEGIFPTKAHDIWVLRNGEREMFVPAVEEFIRSVNLPGREIRIREAEGLSESDGH